MVLELLSIVTFTFALGLFVLGAFTWWLERRHRRKLGAAMMLSGFMIALGYAFLGSRYALRWFGRLIITIDLPRLMATAIIYTLGVLGGLGLAGLLFMWISGRMVQPTRLERQIGSFLALALGVALFISLLAVMLSR